MNDERRRCRRRRRFQFRFSSNLFIQSKHGLHATRIVISFPLISICDLFLSRSIVYLWHFFGFTFSHLYFGIFCSYLLYFLLNARRSNWRKNSFCFRLRFQAVLRINFKFCFFVVVFIFVASPSSAAIEIGLSARLLAISCRFYLPEDGNCCFNCCCCWRRLCDAVAMT